MEEIVELIDLAKTVVVPPMFEVQRMGAEYGIEVIFLHLADPELNPIENVWAVIKNIDIFSIRAIDFQDDDAASLL